MDQLSCLSYIKKSGILSKQDRIQSELHQNIVRTGIQLIQSGWIVFSKWVGDIGTFSIFGECYGLYLCILFAMNYRRIVACLYLYQLMLLRLPTLQGLFRPYAPFSTKKIEIFINNKPYQVDNNLSIFQAAKENGIEIPRFCYHERLKVAGNCRMCLVEVEKSPKPVASCCSQVAPAMKIHTNSEPARLARGGVMQFLLANHPLDCPICDQGGECDLQNNSHYYGYSAGRYDEYKRAVQDKNIGPLVVTHMNRCIHCTRCIRFSEEVAGFHDLGTSGRGRATEINTYVEKMLFSEMSGNLADVCPVGALNNGPFAYTSRPYELLTKNSIDLMDSLGSNVSIDYKENTIMRVNPRVHEAINEEWLSDKSRQAYDGLKRQRLRVPLLRKGADFAEQAWEDVLSMIAARIDKVEGKDIVCGIGEFQSVENIQAMKDFLNGLNCFNYQFRQTNNLNVPNNFRADYLFNSQIEMIEDADVILLVGVNPRTEAPVLNSRILKAINKKKARVLSVGTPADLTYAYTHLGNSASTLEQIASGKHAISQQLKAAKLPLMIVGRDVLSRSDSQAVLTTARNIATTYKFVNSENGWNGFNVLHRSQGEINALELGLDFRPITHTPKVIFLLGCDNNIQPSDIPKDSFVVYIGSHGDQGAQYADVILPAAAYTERSGTYVNTEGRVQMGLKVVEPPGHSREQWEIIRALSEECGVGLPYNSIEELRSRIYSIAPHLLKYDYIEPTVYGKVVNKSWGGAGNIEQTPLQDLIDNYYMTDSISRNSVTMAKCSTAFNPVKFSNFQKIRQQF